MTGPYDLSSDDRLALAFLEVEQMRVQFDLAEEVRKANEAYQARARLADDAFCPTCGKRGITNCNCER